MDLRKVVITTGTRTLMDEEDWAKLNAEPTSILCRTEEEVIAAAHDADAIITHSIPVYIPITRKVISNLEKCRLIHDYGTGYDGTDIEAATDYGICVSNVADYAADEVSDHVMALVLSNARKITRLDRVVRKGKWTDAGRAEYFSILPPMFKLKGQTLGIIGLGTIGGRVVPKAKGFGMRIIACDPYISAERFKKLDVESVTLDELLAQSDFISLNTPLNEETSNLMSIEQLKKMKKTAYLINCSRGGVLDTEALCTALDDNTIAGAGIDVMPGETMELNHPLLKFENVTITPHTAYYSQDVAPEIRRRTFEQLEQVFNGELPKYLINSEVKNKFLQRRG